MGQQSMTDWPSPVIDWGRVTDSDDTFTHQFFNANPSSLVLRKLQGSLSEGVTMEENNNLRKVTNFEATSGGEQENLTLQTDAPEVQVRGRIRQTGTTSIHIVMQSPTQKQGRRPSKGVSLSLFHKLGCYDCYRV